MLVMIPRMRISCQVVSLIFIALICYSTLPSCSAQDDKEGDGDGGPKKPPKEAQNCNGIYASYSSGGRQREYPFVKNVTAQGWAFQADATVINMGADELKSWQLFIGFQHRELLVSVEGATVLNGDGSFPVKLGKDGATLAGYPQADLKTAIDTAMDFPQMTAQIKIKGTQFGGSAKAVAMPRTIKLVNPGYKCPAPAKKGASMTVCCKKDPKYKEKKKNKFLPRRYGDLDFTYDVMKAEANKYLAQVTIENNHPLGRLDQWNLTWTWMRNEFIYLMRGAYTREKGGAHCINGPQGNYYRDFDFSNVVNCEKNPIISDLPTEMYNNSQVGKIPYCCKDGILLPKTINATKSRAIFQMEVFKLPPDMNRTAITPPQNWNIVGRLNTVYKCGPPVRVDPTDFPDPTGLESSVSAIASWQVTCNTTRPKPKESKCCVSYSAYYADAAIPCNTCACGCDADARESDARCDAKAAPMQIPTDALLVPFANRTMKAKAFAAIHNRRVPKKLPCPDNCGVSINWHVDAAYKNGWTARMTIFNWEKEAYVNWSAAIQLKKANEGYIKTYSLKPTKLPRLKNTIMLQGLPGASYLVGETNSTRRDRDPPAPGKQQATITFSKTTSLLKDLSDGDGFPAKVFFNGAECALPPRIPSRNGAARGSPAGLLPAVVLALLTYMLLATSLY